MKRRPAAFALAIAVSFCVATAYKDAWAFSLFGPEGSFALGQWTGELAAGYEWEDEQMQGPSGPSSGVTRNRIDEDVRIRNEGFYLIDPRLVAASSGVNLDFFQEQDKSTVSGNGSQSGTLIGYDFSAVFLSQEPYTGTFSAHRNENDASTLFAGRTHSLSQSFGLTADLREYSFLRNVLPYFSSSIYLRQDQVDESTTQLGETFKLNETRDTVGFEANKGFQTADLNFNYEFVSDSYTGSTPYSFTTQWADLDYSRDFGANLNRNFTSRVSYYTGSGAFNESFLYADERLHIDHFQNLSTTYEYVLSDISNQSQRDTSQLVTFRLEYRPYRNFYTAFSLQGYYDTLSQGHRDYYSAEWTPSYSHSIPWGGTVYLNGDGRYEIDDNQLNGSQVQILNEQHNATPSGFTLNQQFVIASTIVVVDTRSGRIPCVLNRDYAVIPQGILTEIVPIPTSPIIRPGDPLQVSYSYQVAIKGQFSTRMLTAGAGMFFSWINFAFQHQQTDQSMLSGQGSQFLYHLQQNEGTVQVHRHWDSIDARANALLETYDSSSGISSIKYTLQQYGQFLTYQTPWSIVTRLGATQMFINYTGNRETQSTEFEAELERFFEPGNYFSAFGRIRSIRDTLIPNQDYIEAGVRSHWQWGKIYCEPNFSWTVSKYGSLQTNDPHLMLRIGRYL